MIYRDRATQTLRITISKAAVVALTSGTLRTFQQPPKIVRIRGLYIYDETGASAMGVAISLNAVPQGGFRFPAGTPGAIQFDVPLSFDLDTGNLVIDGTLPALEVGTLTLVADIATVGTP